MFFIDFLAVNVHFTIAASNKRPSDCPNAIHSRTKNRSGGNYYFCYCILREKWKEGWSKSPRMK